MLLADVIWPALLLEGRLLTWWAIVAGLAAEAVVVRFCLGMTTVRAIVADVVMNLASTLAGIALIPMAGFAWEALAGPVFLRFGLESFGPIGWTANCFLAIAINTFIEGMVLFVAFKVRPERKVFFFLFLGNTVSVGLAMGSLLVDPREGW